MRIDLAGLDETIRKLQELRKLASDPALAPFVREMEIESARKNGSSTGTPIYESELGTAILQVVSEAGKEFTVGDVYGVLKAKDYKFTGEEPKKSIGNILRALARDEHIRVVKQGRGRRASVYAA